MPEPMTVSELRTARADCKRPTAPGANLGGANLWGANLWGADLWGAGIVSLGETPSGWTCLYPTPDGWHMQVGCWRGSPDDLRALANNLNREWPSGCDRAERGRRAKYLLAALVHVDLITEELADLVPALAAKWGTTNGATDA